MRWSLEAGIRSAVHASQALSPGVCHSRTSRWRPQKQQILPASLIRIVDARSPPIDLYSKRRKGEIHPQSYLLLNVILRNAHGNDYPKIREFPTHAWLAEAQPLRPFKSDSPVC